MWMRILESDTKTEQRKTKRQGHKFNNDRKGKKKRYQAESSYMIYQESSAKGYEEINENICKRHL